MIDNASRKVFPLPASELFLSFSCSIQEKFIKYNGLIQAAICFITSITRDIYARSVLRHQVLTYYSVNLAASNED